MNDNTFGKLVGFGAIGLICIPIIYLFGIGFFTEKPQEFELLGARGGLPFFLAFLWFMNSLFFLWALWHSFWGSGGGAEKLACWLFISGLILLFSVSITCNMGKGYNVCNNNYSDDCPQVLEAASIDMIGKPVICPKCGNQSIVRDFWWN